MNVLAELTEALHEFEQVAATHVAAGAYPLALESLGGDLAHAPDALDRQVLEKGLDRVGRNHELAVGFVPVARDLGDELVRRDAGGYGDADIACNAPADLGRNQRGAAAAGRAPADVEKGFVQRQGFNAVGIVGEDLVHLPRGFAVNRHASRDQDQVRAALQRGCACHRRAHAEPACLVTGGGDDAAPVGAAADRDRFPAQRRVVADLHRGIEAVGVDMNDFSLRRCRRVHGGRLASRRRLGKNRGCPNGAPR